MNKKTVSISLPQFRGVELKNATVDLEKRCCGCRIWRRRYRKDISEIAGVLKVQIISMKTFINLQH